MSAFVLKIIALISMTFDHASYVIYGRFSFLNYIGRLAFPIFAFQITEGYIHTKNLKKYFLRLFIFALISQIPFLLFHSIISSSRHLNIFFTLFLGLGAITTFDKLRNIECNNKYIHYLYIFLGFISVAVFSTISEITNCDYGYFGVLAIFVFYFFKNHKVLMNIAFILSVIIYQFNNLLKNLSNPGLFEIYLYIIIFTCLPLAFIDLYNNKKGKDIKYLLYLFYPIHLLILYGIHLLT